MATEDLIAGLENAIERGVSLEQAKASFINSGYLAREVEEAVNYIKTTPKPPTEFIGSASIPQQKNIKGFSKLPSDKSPEDKKPKKTKIIILGIILLIIVAAIILPISMAFDLSH